ncbi:ribonucleotide-diphosphate reductase subunit beta, partial [Nitrosarchaeum koreense]|nr:ribonucleotide-diphosphate reductase subunit beta [Nitrosarchaeum koreense]
VAAKAVIAARVDVYGEGLNETLLEKLNIRVTEIGKKYENPTEKDIRRPQSFERDGGNFGGRREGGEGRSNYERSDSNKKRKKFGRR